MQVKSSSKAHSSLQVTSKQDRRPELPLQQPKLSATQKVPTGIPSTYTPPVPVVISTTDSEDDDSFFPKQAAVKQFPMADSGISDELVSQFMAFTGSSDTDRAISYLEMSNGNVETAVGLFLEHQGGGGGDPMMGGDMAAASGGFAVGGRGPDGVRAPDATQTMRLMDDLGPAGPMMMGGGGMPPYMALGGMGMDPILQQQLATSAFARNAVNSAAMDAALDASMDHGNDNDDDEADDEDYEYDADADGEEKDEHKPKSPAVAGLADMFAAPKHLMYMEGGFEGARTVAKDSKRWLLVNLQRDSEFSCHALNRDVWRDELVENLIREGFIFWQAMDISPEGSVYAQRYKVFDYPHIGIIDPRTRRLMWKKEGWTQQKPLTAEGFAEIAMDFCSRHSFDKPPQAPRPNAAAAAAVVRPAKKAMHEMSEEEQLQAAMRASLQESGDIPADNDDEDDYVMDDDDEVEIIGTKGPDGEMKPAAAPAAAAQAEDSKPAAAPSIFKQLLAMDVGDEPDKGARIQFRLPDGKRTVRKFDPSQNVRLVYAFVAQSLPEVKEGNEFILKAGFPPKDLISSIDSTIESCSLSGEAITVRFK